MDTTKLFRTVGILGATSLTARAVDADAAVGVKEFVDIIAESGRIVGALGGIIVITVAFALAVIILPYAIYITFFPLIRTMGGSLDVLKTHSAKKKGGGRAAQKTHDLAPKLHSGLTLAYGGDKVEGENGFARKE